MRSIARIVLLVLVLTMMFTMVSSIIVSADNPAGMPDPSKVTDKAIDTDAQNGIVNITGALLKYIQIIGSIVAVIILAVYGVKWFLASPQQKAILKEQAWSYVIGAVLVFGGATLMTWIAATFTGVFSN